MSHQRLTDDGHKVKKGAAVGHGSAPTRSPQRPHQPEPRASDEPTHPLIKIGIDGTVTIEDAPDIAYFPLTLLEPHERTKGIVSTSGNKVVITPTVGPDVVYVVTCYDFDSRRFTAQKAEIADA